MRSLSSNFTHHAAKTGRRTNFFSRYFAVFAVLLFCMYEYGIQRIYGFSIYPDEFGYWASAGQWIGFDWSETASQAAYYSFGYSLILAPVLLLCKSGVSAYRTAVLINMLLQCLSIGLLYGIYRRLFCTETDGAAKENADRVKNDDARNGSCPQEMKLVFAVGTAVFYPVWTFYTQMTLTEALLAFLYILICWLFLRFLEKPVFVRAMLLSIALIYLHFVHMRTVGVVIAAVIILILYAWRVRQARKPVLAAALILIAGAFAGMGVRNDVIGSLYGAAGSQLAGGNGYAAQIANAKSVFNLNGILLLLKSCAGKLYYLGMSSFGLVYPAIVVCVKKAGALLIGLFSRYGSMKDDTDNQQFDGQGYKEKFFFFFLLLSFAGQFLVSAIYMRHSGRLDCVIYGRYNDYLVSVFIGIGVLTLWENRHFLRYVLVSLVVSTVLFAVSLYTALQSGAVLMHGCHAVGLNYISDDLHFYEIAPEFVKAFAFGLGLYFFVTASIALARKSINRSSGFFVVGFGIMLLLELLLTFRLNHKYIYYFNEMNYYDLEIYEYIENYKNPDNNFEMPVYYIHDGGQIYINLIQFAMRDEPLKFIYQYKDGDMISWEELVTLLPQKGFLIMDCDNTYLTQMEERYRKCVESKSEGFALFLMD